eukprot:294603_1
MFIVALLCVCHISWVMSSSLPHIVMMVVDDLGWSDVGYRSYSDYTLKNIDYLQSIGVDLTNYHVHRLCTCTRSAILNGRYAWQNGAQAVFGAETLQHLPFISPTLPQYLKKYGNYDTQGFGKWHVGYAAYNMTPIQRGFNDYIGYWMGAQDYYTHQEGKYLDFFDNNVADWNVDGIYSTEIYNKRAINIIDNFVNKSNEQPLFIYAAYQTVHGPIEPPPDVATNPQKYIICNNSKIYNDERRIFCQKMISLDTIIGNLIHRLKATNLWNDTVIILTTDNGGMPYYGNTSVTGKTANSYSINLPYRSGKHTLFEGGVLGNGFISGGNYKLLPDIYRGKNNTILSHSIDWIPTIIEGMLGKIIDENEKQYLSGVNLWDYILNPNKIPEINTNRTIYVGLDAHNQQTNSTCSGLIHNGYKYIDGLQWGTLYYPIPPEMPYGNYSSINESVFLFNLTNDPYEKINIAHLSENQDLVNMFQNMLDNAQQNMGYMPMQSGGKQADGNPANFNNTYSPWLGAP